MMQTGVDLLAWTVATVLLARVVVGWARWRPWTPSGDPLLTAVVDRHDPRRPGAVACAVLDLNPGAVPLRTACARCDEHSRFEIGSVTKTFTAVLLAQSLARGELRPGTTLGDLWPDDTSAGSAASTVTVAELARHTSGLPRNPLGLLAPLRVLAAGALGLDPDRGLSDRFVRRAAARARLRGRGVVGYSNLGAGVVGQAMASSAGFPGYAALLEARLLRPAGLDETSADPSTPRISGSTALGLWAGPWRLRGYAAAGGATSSLSDMTRYARLLLEGRLPGHDSLDQELFWQVHTTPDGRRRCWHDGQTGGFSSYLAVYPESRRAVVVLASRASAADQARLADACVRAVLDAAR